METIKFDLAKTLGEFKIMNAVNNGPVHKRHAQDQRRSNLAEYKAARIPYARNHDAAFNASYGGEFSVDISAIFPNFDADPYDPESYDFVCTDEYTLVTLDDGSQVRVDSLKGDEMLLVWNHSTGKLESAPVAYIVNHDKVVAEHEVIRLVFSDGTRNSGTL